MLDREIVEMYWQRNEDAIPETEKKYGSYLLKIAANILSDAEDSREVVNDTYYRAWCTMPDNRPEKLNLYLAKITRDLSIDIWRTRRRKKRAGSEYALSLEELEEAVPAAESTEDTVEKKLVNDQGACAVYATLIFQPYNTASAENHGIIPEDELAYAYKKVYDGRFDDVRLGGKIPEGDFPAFYQISETFLLKQDGYYELYFGDMGTDDPWRDLGFHETE